jgi:hypothetical protein
MTRLRRPRDPFSNLKKLGGVSELRGVPELAGAATAAPAALRLRRDVSQRYAGTGHGGGEEGPGGARRVQELGGLADLDEGAAASGAEVQAARALGLADLNGAARTLGRATPGGSTRTAQDEGGEEEVHLGPWLLLPLLPEGLFLQQPTMLP